jgi:hypothetical protein
MHEPRIALRIRRRGGPGTGLDDVEKRKIYFPSPEIRLLASKKITVIRGF